MGIAAISAVLAAAASLAVAGGAPSATADRFVIRVGDPLGPESLDPAVATSSSFAAINYATCMKLVNFPDSAGRAGTVPVAEAAKQISVSRTGRVYTFHLRPGLQFSDGHPLTAAAFAYTYQRLLDPRMNSVALQTRALDDVVGARARRLGKATRVSGIRAHGTTLQIRLVRNAPDLLARLAMPQACPVPVGFPIDRAGVDNPPVPGSGPYAIAEYRPGREVILARNPHYRGTRPHTPDEIDVTIGGSPEELTDAVDRGQLDYVVGGPPVERLAELRRQYGVNHSRLWDPVRPQTFYLAFNFGRSLFRNNASLRRAISFALDRPAIVRAVGDSAVGRPTDQLLPPSMPGFVDRNLYPVNGPSLAIARRLARGHLRGARAVLYVSSSPTALARGAAVQRELARIGLQVDIRAWGVDLFALRLSAPNEPYDMTIISFTQSWPDPGAFLGPIIDSRLIPAGLFNPLHWNLSHFKDAAVDARLTRAARLAGGARRQAYARLERDVLAHQAPVAAIYYLRDVLFVSNRIGCVTYNPVFTVDYAKLCRR